MPEQKAFVVEVFLKNNESHITTIRKFRAHFKLKSNEKVPDLKTVKNWTEKFRQSGSTTNEKPTGTPKRVRTPTKIKKIWKAVIKSPNCSVKKHAASLGISERISLAYPA